MIGTKAALAVLCCLGIGGCMDPPRELTEADVKVGLAWVRPGVTTRTDVLLKFGLPAMTFEKQRIFAYRVAVLPNGTVRPATVMNVTDDPRLQPWGRFSSLVLVFDDSGVVSHQSVVMAEK